MKIRLLITALVCALALSACNNSKSDDSASTGSVADSSRSESNASKSEYETKTSFKLSGRWKYIEIDADKEKASGLKFGVYRAMHEEDDNYKIYDFGENSIGYCENDDEYFPYFLQYKEYHSAKGNNKSLGLKYYTDDPNGNYNMARFWLQGKAPVAVRAAEGTIYCEDFILVRISSDTSITAGTKDKEIYENIPGKWEAQDGSGGKYIYYLFADGSAWISHIDSSEMNTTFYSGYGVLNGTIYIDGYTDGIHKSSITLSGDTMTLDDTTKFIRTEKDGYETSNEKTISLTQP